MKSGPTLILFTLVAGGGGGGMDVVPVRPLSLMSPDVAWSFAIINSFLTNFLRSMELDIYQSL